MPERASQRPNAKTTLTTPDQTAVIPKLRDAKTPRRDPWGEDEDHSDVPPGEQVHVNSIGVWPWLLPALLMAVVGYAGITRPSLWTDELASWGMTTVSYDDMFKVLKYVDAIIGPYYVLLHGWTDLVGNSDLMVRLPSLAAMVLAAGLIGALGARLASRRVGLAAGLIFAVLPSSARFAQEARVYALATFFAVLATVTLVAALRRPGFFRWLGYLLAVAVLGVLHPISLLLLGAHGWVVFAQYRHRTLGWMITAFLGALPALPLLKYGSEQKAQVSWITKPDTYTLQHFPGELVGTASIAALILVLSLFALPLRRPTALYTAWAVLPPIFLVVAAQFTPIFLTRYLLFSLPAWALLAAVALGRAKVVWTVLGVLAIAGLAVPAQLDIRATDGHGEASREMALTIADGFKPGDGIVYGMTDPGGNWVGRDSIAHYTPADRQPKDVLATQPQRTNGSFAALECPDIPKCLGDTPRLWVVRLGYQEDPLGEMDNGKSVVIAERYKVTQTWRQKGFTLALAVKK
ncbi:hypothetical protein Ahu01nite_013550 [Winogradskya humida]|uniref:Glycosyltransferase RgtA/B/C/D-like domain-containing protein n=1 Tax=Winogradskya humida TaxID=113566 RepID=A0ABQ3ZI82_9ACTN|nr:hypothetical protein Ahu01nite_013550 [Actinoplanes humidus]